MSNQLPGEVKAFHERLASLPGVLEVTSTVRSLVGITGDDLKLVDFGRLPHAALRRTDGGLEGEVLAQFEVVLDPLPHSWKTLEFLAWFVRDQARGGEWIQLRPFGLPPSAGNQIQLGRTLRFHIDLFVVSLDGSLTPVLQHVGEVEQGLRIALSIYGDLLAVGERVS